MALLRLEEAIDLGLIPMSAAGRFPPLARSQLFGSPMQLRFPRFSRPGTGPLERGVGRFGLQHMGPAISPVRFGLGPLMAGLGLSPSQSAMLAPGAVPVGRAAARGGGAEADLRTLLGRGDVETIRQLVAQGAVDPRLVPPGILAVAGGGGPGRRVAPAAGGDGGPSEVAQAISATRQALAASKFLEPILRAPTGSFARDPGSEAAFQAQRRGEREPFTATGIEAGALGPFVLSPEVVSGASGGMAVPAGFDPSQAVPFEVSPEILSGASGGAGALGAGLGPATYGAQIAAEGGAQGLRTLGATGAGAAESGGLTSGLGQLIGPALSAAQIGMSASQGDPVGAGAGALNLGLGLAGLGYLAPAVAALAGAFKTSVLRSPPESHAAREFKEVGEAIQNAMSGGQISFAMSPTELYDTVVAGGSGSTGGQRRTATIVSFEGLPGVVGRGEGNISEEGFRRALRESPEHLRVSMQAGVNPRFLAGTNESIRRAILRQGMLLDAAEDYPSVRQSMESRLAEEQNRAGAARLAHIERFRGGQTLDEYGNVQYAAPIEAYRPETLPPSPPIPQDIPPEIGSLLSSLPPVAWTPRPPSPTQSPADTGIIPPDFAAGAPGVGHGGGLVPVTGVYRLQQGEVVLPSPTRPAEAGGNWYLPTDDGPLRRAPKNPDPARYWRVAQGRAEAQEAVRSGDPAELPILAPPGVLALGPRKRAASLEFLRRAQHENPAGTLSDVLAMS